MATITSLGFSIFSTYDGTGVNRARRDIRDLADVYGGANRQVREFAGGAGVLRTAMLGLAPALLPVAEATGAVAAGMAAMGVAAGTAVGAYAAVGAAAAKAALQKAAEGKALTGMEKQYISAYNNMMQTWRRFVTTTGAKTLQPQIEVIKGLTAGIRGMGPVINALHPVIMRVATAFRKWMEGPGFERFRDGVIKYGVPAFNDLQEAGRNALAAIGIGYRAFLPLAVELSEWILKASEAFRNWAEDGGFQRFLDRTREQGPAVKELLRALWDLFKKLMDVVRQLSPYALQAATSLAQFAASLPTPVIAGLVAGFIALRTAVSALLVPMAALRLVMGSGGLFGIFGQLLPVFIRFAGVIGIFVTAITLAWQHSSFFREQVSRLWVAIQQLWQVFQPLVQQLQIFWDKLAPVRELLGQFIGFILGTAVGAITLFVQFLGSLVQGITALWQAFNTFLSSIPAIWDTVWNGLRLAAENVWNVIKNNWNLFLTGLLIDWQTVSGALATAWNTFWSGIRTLAEGAWNGIKTAWQTTLNWFSDRFNAFKEGFQTTWSNLWSGIRTLAENIWNNIKNTWQTTLNYFSDRFNAFKERFQLTWSTLWNSIRTLAENIWNGIKTAWQTTLNWFSDRFNAFKEGFQTTWSTLWNSIRTLAENIWNNIKNTWQTTLNWVRDRFNDFKERFQDGWSNLWNRVKDIASDIWDKIKGVIRDAINAILKPVNLLIDGFNRVADAVGLDIEIPNIRVNFAAGGIVEFENGGIAGGEPAFFARGGVIPGYQPGRDTVHAMLSRGEGVLVPEAVKGLGPDFVHWANYHFSHGRGGKNVNFPGYAKGGIVGGAVQAWHRVGGDTGWAFQGGGILDPDGRPNQGGLPGLGGPLEDAPERDNIMPKPKDDDDGGILGGIGDFFKDMVGGLVDVFTGRGSVAGLVLGFIGREAIEKAFDIVFDALDEIPGIGGPFMKILKGIVEKLTKGAIEWLVKKDEAAKEEFMAKAVAGAQSVQAWAPLAAKALAMAGLSPSQLPAFLSLMAAESGGNPNAINNWDINARNGVPSQGLMQVIPPTFAAYHVPGTSNNILDPLANMAAAANYIKHRYGGIVPGSPYADGTDDATPGMHLVGEEGPELVTKPGYAMFGGGEQVYTAAQTAQIMSPPSLPKSSGGKSGGSKSGDPLGLLNQLTEAALAMREAVAMAWQAAVSSGKSGLSALGGVHSTLVGDVGSSIPSAFGSMQQASATAWTGMTAQTTTHWNALKAGPYTEAQTTATVAMPAAMTAMSTANTTHWTKMSQDTGAQWGLMRDTTFTEANDFIAVKMPTWADEMNQGVSTSFQNMNEATAESWGGMQEATRAPVNWIISNAYNSGLANLWNKVAEVIFEDGAKTLPTVATLAKGGPVNGPGTGTSDSIPARLSRGEHVWTAREVKAAGGHAAVAALRSAALDGHGPAHGFAAGGWFTGSDVVSGGLNLPSVGELKRGFLMDEAEPVLDAIDSGVRAALGGNSFRKMGAVGGALSPSDWIRQYLEKDDELNRIGSGGPPWIPGVSDRLTTYDGHTVNQRTADMLNMAKALGASFSITQGSFSTGVAASAGTHNGGGVVDLVPAGDHNVGPLRAVGFAAWNRGAAYGSPSFSPHIHAVALGDPTVSPAAAAQIQSYLAGGNGLANNGPDNYSGGIPSVDGVAAIAGAGRNVDPADLDQRVVAFDKGGWFGPGYHSIYNGTGKPELATPADDIENLASAIRAEGVGGNDCVHVEFNFNGPVRDGDDVRRAVDEALPKLRSALQVRSGTR